ncbi:MAG TPA: biotin/lipoyl-binding protein, partial [Candidatus Dormibacteraeota bacterium]|nr:biotin/lipoyl-binding protein [Candidatus Dormibacteraeota bacterium]
MGTFKNFAAISLLGVLFVVGCSDAPGAGQTSSTSGVLARPQSASAVPVVVAKVQRTSIPIELHAIGTGQAFKTVSVESQVAGIIETVYYRPGGFVHQGDLLVKLDGAPFLATLSQDQAALARDKAQDELDSAELGRYNELYRDGVVSKEQYDQYQAT